MRKYADWELKKELTARGYVVLNNDYATDHLWTLDDAIDSYRDIKNEKFTNDELSHKQLMAILNGTISSEYIMEMISEELQKNIYENLFKN